MIEFLKSFWSKLSSSRSRNPNAPSVLRKAGVANDGPPDTSLRDPVTGLYNRKHLVHRLDANMARLSRSKKEKMAVILWDIDGFVDFNNRFGQEEGDKFLRKVAEIIHRSIRSYDEGFRSGGDEFCALLIPSDEKVAKEVTERVRQAVSKDLFQENAEYAGRQFSISSGLVFHPGASQVPEALLHEARQELYRNRMKPVQG